MVRCFDCESEGGKAGSRGCQIDRERLTLPRRVLLLRGEPQRLTQRREGAEEGSMRYLTATQGEWRRAARGICVAVCGMLLIGVCVGVRGDDSKRGDAVQAELDRVAKMSFAEQQTWLERLDKRAARAARLALPPEEAVRQVARTRSMLHQKTVTWVALREVLADTAAREMAATAAKLPAAGSHTGRGSQSRMVKKPLLPAPPGEPLDDAVSGETDTLASDAVKVNVDELETRIAACNLAFRELEADLTEKGTWTAAKLEPLTDRLKVLVLRHNDLGLVREAAPKEQRGDITKLETPKAAISQLSARVVEARDRANDPKFAGNEAERRAELTRLEAISRRLAESAGK
jgi:hypothetical protein